MSDKTGNIIFIPNMAVGLSVRGELEPYDFKMSIFPIWCLLFGVKVLVKTYILSGRMNSLNLWYLPFFLLGTLENLMKVDLILYMLTHFCLQFWAILEAFKSQLSINPKL